MTRSRAAAAALAVALAAPSAVAAQPETYFEPETFHREGVTFGLLFQGGGFLSTSCCDIGGRRGAGGGGIRIGTVATPRLLWMLQIEGASVPIDEEGEIFFNRHGTFTVGGQLFLATTLWVQAGLGFATYTIEKTTQETNTVDLQRSGFAFSSSVGFEFLRKPNAWSFGLARQDFSLSYEIRVVGGLYPGGAPVVGEEDQATGGILQITMGLGLQWY